MIGTSSVSLGAFKTPYRAKGAGSQPLDWYPLNLTASDGSAGNDPKARTVARFSAAEPLIDAARRATPTLQTGTGCRRANRIERHVERRSGSRHAFRTAYGTIVEEMETAAAAQIAGQLGTPFLGIRVVSDNITNGGYDPKTSEACLDFVFEVIKSYIATLKR